MDKKKAIKLATASAVAASAFVAANPNASEAATNVASVVSQAKAQFKNAYYAYSQVTSTGKFADINTVYAEYNKAKKAYADAVALVKKAGGANKDALLADLDATYNEYVAKRVVTYLDAYNYAVKLDALRKDLQAAVDAKDLAKAEDLYNKISYELKKRTVILDRVYGQTTRDLLRSQFKAAAQQLRDSLVYDITVSVKLKAAEEATNKGDLTAADAALKAAQDALAKATAFKTELTTKQATVQAAYEAKVTPKVESVSAINAKELVVKFNKAIDKSTVIADATTGTLVANTITVGRTVADTDSNKNVSSVKGSLSEDGKTLTLTAAGTTYFDGTYALTIADSVKTTDGKALTAYAGTFTAKDTVAPSATGVTFNTVTGNIEVTFSEPLTAKPDVVRVNGQPIAAADITLSGDAKKITFAKPTSLAAGSSAEIYVTGAKDAAGNSLAPFTGSVTITNDATALQVASITQVASNKVKVVFNKSIATSEANVDDAINVILGGVTLGDAEVVVTKDASDTSNKTYFVEIQKSGTTAPNYFYGTDSSKALTFVFVDQAIADVFGQKLATTTQTVTMTKDVAGPKFVSAKVGTTNGTIEVTLDEEISSSVDVSKITVRKDGIALSNPVTAAKKGSSNGAEKVLVITLNSADLDANGKLNAGTYSVRLDSGAVQDVHTNKNDIITTSVTKDATTTDLTATISTVTGQRNKFEVVYSESVTSSALNPANYTLDGKALPAGTDIYFKGSTGVDARTAVIVLPSNSINIGVVGTGVNASLAVKDVVTSTGKKVVPTSGTVLVEDNTPAKLKSATLIGSNILKLTFDENITASGVSTLAKVISELEIKAADGTALTAGTTGSATVSTSGKDLIITITPGDSNWSTVTGSSTVTVKTLDSGSTDGLTDLILDANGVKVKAGEAVTLTK